LLDTFSFEITDNIFSRDEDDYNGQGLWNGEDVSGISNGYIMGNMYQFENNTSLDAVRTVLTASTDVGTLFYAAVYSYDNTTGDFTLIGQSVDYTVSAADIPTVNGPGAPEVVLTMPSIALTAGETYLVAIGHYGGADAIVLANSTTAQASANTTFMFDATDFTWYFLNSVPMIRAQFNVAGIEDAAITGINLKQNVPNPADNNSTIAYTLERSGGVALTIVDLSGKTVAVYNQGNQSVGSYTIEVNTEALAAGIYHYTLSVDGYTATKKMVVTK